MRLWITAFVLLVPAAALAQTEPERAWSDFNAQSGAIESASTQDCATACKALESLARAAQHLCDVAPEHCDEAKAKLRAASDRVHAACPQCEVRAEVAPPRHVDFQSGTVQGTTVSEATAKRGGCAGCAIATQQTGGGALAFVAALLAGIRRRRRRRDDLGRVRDLDRVEPHRD